MDLRVNTRGAPHHNLDLFDVEVREGVPDRIDFPERKPTAPPRELAIRFVGANLPDNVDTNQHVHIECEGQGASWTCLCPGEGECHVVARCTDVIFDWSYNSEEVARVPAEQDDLVVDLDRPIVELSGVWTGPLPCFVRARLPEAGVGSEEGCAHDGSFVLPELRAGLWELELGWRIDSFQVGFVVPPRRLQLEIGEDDVDLGSVAP